ncbi:MAG: hypothetical protein Q8R67_02505 [Rhodoferax sp.]|nr:hypothetical protein [Rhodoferax sp.]MDP3650532.1 hypothetical protein [Rhodoferax sp.]
MSFGIRIQGSDGSTLISQDVQNQRLIGPIVCSANSTPGTVLDACATHKCTFTSDITPLVYIKLPPHTSNGNGGGILGVTKSGSTYTVYVIAVGYTPSIYYTTSFAGAPIPAFGMALFDAAGVQVWNSEDTLMKSEFQVWSSDRVATVAPGSLTLYSRATYLSNPRAGDVVGGFVSASEVVIGDFVSNLAYVVVPIYSKYLDNFVFAYPATVKLAMGPPVSRVAVYDAATGFSYASSAQSNAATPVNRSSFIFP